MDLLHLAEYCLVISVILASTALTLHLIRKRETVRRSDVGPPLSRRQLGGAIAIIAIFSASLLSINLYTDRTMEPWTFEEWASGNLHIVFLAILCLILFPGSFRVAARHGKKTEAPESAPVPKPAPRSDGKSTRSDGARLVVIVLVLPAILIVWVIPFPFTETYNETYLERVPYNVTRIYTVREPYTHNRTLESPLQISPGAQFLRNYPIHTPPGEAVHIACVMHLEAYNNTLVGEIKDGGDMDFYIFNNTEYMAWSQGHESQPHVSIKHVENSSFQFVPNQSETYHVVLDNRLSSLNKTPKLTLIHSFAAEVTGSHYVTRTRNITKHNETLKTHKLTRTEWTTLAKRWFQ